MERKEKRGYTLVEMMIVMLIIGLLSSIILPHMVKGRYHAQYTSCQANLRNMAAALEIYHTDKGTYPEEGDWRDKLFNSHPTYMHPEPRCPSNDSQYGYAVSEDLHNFTAHCNGIHHIIIKAVKKGFPQYSTTEGLVTDR